MSSLRSDEPAHIERIEELSEAFAATLPPPSRTLRQRLQLRGPFDLEMIAEEANVALSDEDKRQARGEDEEEEVRHLKPEELAFADRKGEAHAAERGILGEIGEAAHDIVQIADDGDGEICGIEDQCPSDNGGHIRHTLGELGGVHRHTAVQQNE